MEGAELLEMGELQSLAGLNEEDADGLNFDDHTLEVSKRELDA